MSPTPSAGILREFTAEVASDFSGAAADAHRRYLFVDALRGLAVLWVACFHFYSALSHAGQKSLWGSAIHGLLLHANSGIQILFVLCGFVIASSLHGTRVRLPIVGKVMLLRALRLDPVYWVVVALSLVAILAARPLGGMRAMFSGEAILMNLFYLQDILHGQQILNVAWAVCIQLQFYLVFVVSMWLLHTLAGKDAKIAWRLLVFAPLALYSALIHARIFELPIEGSFIPWWFHCFLGVLVWWTLTQETSRFWLFGYLVLCSAPLLVRWEMRAVLGVGTCLALYTIGSLGLLWKPVRVAAVRYLAKISYSFLLIHPLVGNRFLRYAQHYLPDSIDGLTALGLFTAAMALSLLAAHLLYRFVEKPCYEFSNRVRWETESLVAVRQPPAWYVTAESGLQTSSLARSFLLAVWDWLHGLITFMNGHRRWSLVMALFIAVWIIELFLVQRHTLIPPQVIGPRLAFWGPKVRLLFDVLFISTLAITIPRAWLAMVSILAFFGHLGLIAHHYYFLRPLSVLTLMHNWREGRALSKFALDLFPYDAVLLLGAALAVKIGLLWLARRHELPRRFAFVLGCLLLIAYFGLSAIINRVDPLYTIQTTRGIARLGFSRGYLGPWLAEIYYLGDKEILKRAIDLRSVVKDRLTPIEADIPVRERLVIIQAESLDYNVLGHIANGQEVTPFLNRLRDWSLFYRVRAAHFTGSADADFVMLNGVFGSPHIITYNIPGYPYKNTLPQFLSRFGFETYAFHGNIGRFYNRRDAFERMGFAGIYFQEELESRFQQKTDLFGIKDTDVLLLSSLLLRKANGRVCHTIITLTTHTPYTFLAASDEQIYPNPRSATQRYMNNMRFLDNALREYVASLPGAATVMIYADHPTEVGSRDFKPARKGPIEYIPCFIHDTRENLADLQKTRHDPLVASGELHLLDVVTYLRGQVERNYGRKGDEKISKPVADQSAAP